MRHRGSAWRALALASATLIAACGGQNNPAGGGGGATGASPAPSGAPTPVAVPAGFFENGASAVTIKGSGSDALEPFALSLGPDGKIMMPVPGQPSPQPFAVQWPLVSRFYADLLDARPLSGLALGNCPTAIGHDYHLTVSLGGADSPNLLCPGDDKAARLARDVIAILNSVGFRPAEKGSPAPSPGASLGPSSP